MCVHVCVCMCSMVGIYVERVCVPMVYMYVCVRCVHVSVCMCWRYVQCTACVVDTFVDVCVNRQQN